jgi:hypothetical protein
VRRPVLLALALAGSACSPAEPPTCPGARLAAFHFAGSLVAAGDPALAGLDPAPEVPDCADPIVYPDPLAGFDATLSADPATTAAALCRADGIVLYGERTGPARFAVETGSDGAILGDCSSSCTATLRLVVSGDLVADPGGGPDVFRGVLVEVLTRSRGDCGSCLPPIPGTDPVAHACAGRYAITGTP